MTLEPPAPPTAPAPAIRPTPPTPPRIDKGVFSKPADSPPVTRKVETPETMARDAVAHGAGALTKRTVERGDDEQAQSANQSVTVIPPVAPLKDTQSEYDKGKDVLREFRDLDAREAKSAEISSSTEQPTQITPRLNQQEGHGGFYWLFTIIFVIVAAGAFGKKFLYTGKPARVRTPMFDGLPNKTAEDKPKPAPNKTATADKPKPVTPPPTVKPVTLPPKKDDDKGKHFEVRV